MPAMRSGGLRIFPAANLSGLVDSIICSTTWTCLLRTCGFWVRVKWKSSGLERARAMDWGNRCYRRAMRLSGSHWGYR